MLEIDLEFDERFKKPNYKIEQILKDTRFDELIDSANVIDQILHHKVSIQIRVKNNNVELKFQGIYAHIILPNDYIGKTITPFITKFRVNNDSLRYTEVQLKKDINDAFSEDLTSQFRELIPYDFDEHHYLFNDFGFFMLFYYMRFVGYSIDTVKFHNMFKFNPLSDISLVDHLYDNILKFIKPVTIGGLDWILLPPMKNVYYYDVNAELKKRSLSVISDYSNYRIGWLCDSLTMTQEDVYKQLIKQAGNTSYIFGYHEYMKTGHPHIHVFETMRDLEIYSLFNVYRTWISDKQMIIPSEGHLLSRYTYCFGTSVTNDYVDLCSLMSLVGAPVDVDVTTIKTINQMLEIKKIYGLGINLTKTFFDLRRRSCFYSRIMVRENIYQQYQLLFNKINDATGLITTLLPLIQVKQFEDKIVTNPVDLHNIKKEVVIQDIPVGVTYNFDDVSYHPIGLGISVTKASSLKRRWYVDLNPIFRFRTYQLNSLNKGRLAITTDNDLLLNTYRKTYWKYRELYNTPLDANNRPLVQNLREAFNYSDAEWRNARDVRIMLLHALIWKENVSVYNQIMSIPNDLLKTTDLNGSTLKLLTCAVELVKEVVADFDDALDTYFVFGLFGAIQEPLRDVLKRLSRKWKVSGYGLNAFSPSYRTNIFSSFVTKTFDFVISDIDAVDTRNCEEIISKIVYIITYLDKITSKGYAVKIQYALPVIINAIADLKILKNKRVKLCSTMCSPFGSLEIFLLVIKRDDLDELDTRLFEEWIVWDQTLKTSPNYGHTIKMVTGEDIKNHRSILDEFTPTILLGLSFVDNYYVNLSYMLRYTSELHTGTTTSAYNGMIGMYGFVDRQRVKLSLRSNRLYNLKQVKDLEVVVNKGSLRIPITFKVGSANSDAAVYNLAMKLCIEKDIQRIKKTNKITYPVSFLDIGGRALEGIGVTELRDEYVVVDPHPLPEGIEKYRVQHISELFDYTANHVYLKENQIILALFVIMNGENNERDINLKLHNLHEIAVKNKSIVYVNFYTTRSMLELYDLSLESVRIDPTPPGRGTFGSYELVPLMNIANLQALQYFEQIIVNHADVYDAIHQFNLGITPSLQRFLFDFNMFCGLWRFSG